MRLRTAMTRDAATARTLRLALGIALAQALSGAFAWPAAFLCPVLVSVLLAQPLPVPGLRAGLSVVVLLVLSLLAGLGIALVLRLAPPAGVLLLLLSLFLVFRFAAGGGSALAGKLLSLGLAAVSVVGTSSIDLAIVLVVALAVDAAIAMLLVWLAHALVPDSSAPGRHTAPVAAIVPSDSDSTMLGFRAILVVAPLLLWFLLVPDAASYLAVLIQVMALGQQACTDRRRGAARALILSTVIGGVSALAVWSLLRIWPALPLYTLLVLLAGLVLGRKVFTGGGLADDGPIWSYALTTMMVILGPVTGAGEGGDAAWWKFIVRVVMMMVAALYAGAAVWLFDRLLAERRARMRVRSSGYGSPDGIGRDN